MESVVAYIIIFPCLLIEFLVGIYLKFFTPKFDPNYGFRTKYSLSSEVKWNFSNKRIGLYLLIFSIVQFIILIPIFIFFLEKYFVLIICLYPVLEVILLWLLVFIVNQQTKKLPVENKEI